MTTLEAILEEAISHPFVGNATILSDDQFATIRAPSSEAFRDRLDAALVGPGDLADAETQNLSQGLGGGNPVRGGIHGGYWYLQNISSRGELFPAGEQHYGSLVEALEAAIEWWQVESWCRGVMVRRFH